VPAARATRSSAALSVALVSGAFALCSFPGFLKYAGRENSLVPLSIGGWAVAISVAPFAVASLRRALPAGLAWLVVTLIPPGPRFSAQDRREIEGVVSDATEWAAGERAQGKNVLVYSSTVMDLEAHARSISRDRLQSATELFLAGRPEFRTHLARLCSYDALVASTHTFSDAGTHIGTLGRMLRARVNTCFDLVAPKDAKGIPFWPESEGGVVLFRRKASVLASAPQWRSGR
jgi:hypothetical protein